MKYARHIKSKLLKTSVLLKDRDILPHIPETRLFTPYNLRRMLQKYGMVYVKPDRGSFGWGVMKVEREPCLECSRFALYFRRHRWEYASHQELVAAVNRIRRGKPYLVQRGIRMITHGDCPLDIRVMVQLSLERVWETTGYLARVAARGRIVTNFHSGGTPMELKPLLSAHLSPQETETYVNALCRLGESVARHLHRFFPGIKEVGLDIALQGDMKPWILEVNTNPHSDVFMAIGNWEMYCKIWKYARAYGKHLPRPPQHAL